MLRLSGDSRYLYTLHPHSIVVVGWNEPVTQEFRFTLPQSKESFTTGAWLLFLSMSSFEPSVKDARVWKIKYTVKATK